MKNVKRAAKVSTSAFAMAKVPKKIKKKIYTLRYHIGEAVIHTGEKIQGAAYDPERPPADGAESEVQAPSGTDEAAASEESASSGTNAAWEQEKEYEEEKFEGTNAPAQKPAKTLKKLKKVSNT
ncbi:hypothetical protein ACFOLK_08470 [Marinococcus halophilus]|nr:hypothetical protein [Marinococcus halophilus]